MFSLGYLCSIRRLEVISGHDVVNIVDSSGSHSNFGEVNWPDSSVCIFGCVLGEVGSVHVIVDVSLCLKYYLSLSSHSW